MNTANQETPGTQLPVHTIAYITDTASAQKALDRLRTATYGSADTETVVKRDEVGNPLPLNIVGEGPCRVISMAGCIDGVIESYVFDLGTTVDILPEVTASYGVAGVTDIDRSVLATYLAQLDPYAWNADFDERVLEEAHVPMRSWKDLMLAQASLSLGELGANRYDSLGYASKRYLGVAVEGKGSVQLSYTLDDPLTAEQVYYAGIDAVTTTALAPIIMGEVERVGLTDTVTIEWNARPFRSKMERRGIYLDVPGWRSRLVGHQDAINAIEAELAKVTDEVAEFTLFDYTDHPSWNPNSTIDVKRVLNQHAPEAVRRYLNEGGRLFEKSDSVDSAALQLMHEPLATLLLKWRAHSKTISTYGEKFIAHVRPDGRIHARYMQNIVSTGRLSSSGPNMQNIDPTMKVCFRPECTLSGTSPEEMLESIKIHDAKNIRVYVMGDLSQAELRFAAEITKDEALMAAFLRGDDMHVVTASRMFHVDMQDLAKSDPKEYGIYRQRGKTMNFAVIYGLGAKALAQTLTLAGVPTTEAEGKTLLALYLEAFPQVAEWLLSRDTYIRGLSGQPPRCDFTRSLKLYRLRERIRDAKRELVRSKDINLVSPGAAATAWQELALTLLIEQLTSDSEDEVTDEQIAAAAAKEGLIYDPDRTLVANDRKARARELANIPARAIALHIEPSDDITARLEKKLGRAPLPEELEDEITRCVEMIEWAESFRVPVILLEDGTPLKFESRTILGRRRTFQVLTKSWMNSIITSVMRAKRGNLPAIRVGFEQESGEKLTMEDGSLLSRKTILKRFEKKELRDAFMRYIFKSLGGQAEEVFYRALSDRIGALGNAYRNAPIQGGVADAGLLAFGLLIERLEEFDDAFPVQSVHDSVVIECSLYDALAVSTVLQDTMGEALRFFCPSVPAKVDIEISISLGDKDEKGKRRDIISPADLELVLASL
jgi:DNA polymerase I-like protein with 3'-5' exonuclease and polymerase domains